jgi:hypothetical protein
MEDAKPKTFVFVLMPFHESFSDIFEAGIRPACKDAGAYCERVDEQMFDESILDRVYNQIAKADIIIAEMTGRNPNVFYEAGYAHGLNKRVIFLTQNSDDIPFDLKHYPHIVYGGKIAALKSQLEDWIRWGIENPRQHRAFDFFVNKTPLREDPQIYVTAEYQKDLPPNFELDIGLHNPTTRMVRGETFGLAVVAPPLVAHTTGVRSFTRQPNGDLVCNLPRCLSILPDGRENFYVKFVLEKSMAYDKPIRLILRLFMETGTKDHPFSVLLNPVDERTGLALNLADKASS